MPNQNLLKNKFKVVYPDFPGFEQTPNTVRIIQKAGHQDIAEISYELITSFYQRALKPGSLVKISWSNSYFSGNFFGQVISVNPEKNFGQRRPTTVKVIGTALALKESTSKIWVNKKASQIVEEISKKFKLKSVVVPTKPILTQESMVGQTYWQKLRNLADKSGYVFHVFNTDLYFLPFDTMIKKFTRNIPLLSMETTYGNGMDYEAMCTLLEFSSESEAIPSRPTNSNRTKNIVGIDPITGKMFQDNKSKVGKSLRRSVNPTNFSEQMFSVTVGSKSLAESRAIAAAQMSRWSERARAMAQGDPRIAPYRTIQIRGTGVTTDGLWIVQSADHFMAHDGRYTVDISCMTDGSGGNTVGGFRSSVNEYAVRNVAYELASGLETKPSFTKLNATRPLITQSNSGLDLKQRRWVGR